MHWKPYREAIGALLYAALNTHPDLIFSITLLSQFMENPGPAHWIAIQHVFRYIQGTISLSLTFGHGEKGLSGYSDSDWASQPHRHSIAGYVFTIDGTAVSWSSKKQPIVALSSTEAEYIALTHAAKEAVWLRNLLSELLPLFNSPIHIFSDNQLAIANTKDSRFHSHTKHIDIRYHFIREQVEHGTMTISYLSTHNMLADCLTKPLPPVKVTHFNSLLGLALS
jgi:hypothetical protein